MIALAIALGGAIGAPARYLVERGVTRRTGHGFPWGTTAVNLLGSLLLGLVTGASQFHGWSSDARAVAGTGFLGAFTTFSTFAIETERLPARRAVAYVAISVVGGIALAATGLALMAA